jgi:hemolysin activation/secretion protein
LVRDNGLLASLEARIPVVRYKRWAEYVQVVPFVDFGWGWNQKIATPEPTTLVSLGLGLRWAATLVPSIPLQSQCEIFWGYKLKDVDTEGGDLQDYGLHLQFVLSAF